MARSTSPSSASSGSSRAGSSGAGSSGSAGSAGSGSSGSSGSAGSAGSGSSAHPDGWPGKDLGLPEEGPRSVGRIGRRVVALLIDGALADLVAYVTGVWSPVNGSGDIAHSWIQIAIFAVLQILFICLLSGSFGHICVGLRVVPMRGGYVGVWRPVVRTVLLCLVFPALIIDRDSRGAHDRIAGTVLVRR